MEREAHIIWFILKPEKAASVTALRRRPLGSERHLYTIDELGTYPMAVDGINKWTPSRKVGEPRE